MLVCTAIKNAINGIKLCLSFSPGFKFQAVYFKTRSSADADNRLDAFSGQSRSTNMVGESGARVTLGARVTPFIK